ncbi:MAG: thiamine diphosphokinase [Rhizobiaceae bacterium]|nr:thiamine diphosphokinase [Rhizobiaceae bacterium]
MSQFTILLGGDLVATPRLRAQIAASRVIAADSGIRHAVALGVVPELWAGDFDSATEEHLAEHAAIPTARFSHEKDKTDGEIAIDIAIERGAKAFVIAGAFGGERADHEYLHLAVAMRMAEDGHDVLLTSGTTEGRPLLPGRASFDYPPGTVFSVIGFNELTGLTLKGVKWPLDKRLVPFGSSLTMSNEVMSSLDAELEAGRAMLIAHLPEGAR